MSEVSIVIPAYNEQEAIHGVVTRLREVLQAAGIPHEILVVDDGSSDATARAAAEAGATVVQHPQNRGYGRSLKTGILAARYDRIAITDADGTYPADRLPELIALSDRFHMVVGARTGKYYRGTLVKRLGRFFFRLLSEYAAGQRIADINSGMRVFHRHDVRRFFPLICAGFSFTTTTTLVYLLNDLCVHHVPIDYQCREGYSKVNHFRDTLRALQIIVEAILRYNPIKIFLLLAFPFVLLGAGFLIGAVMGRNWPAALCACVAWATAGLVLGQGFLAVSVMPQRRFVNVPTESSSRDPGDDSPHDM
ncbi:MAG: glycosyltransferase [Planctomycetaceae bacterium]|nr:glycosyltransferase [Planctomycetaceae bacterium]